MSVIRFSELSINTKTCFVFSSFIKQCPFLLTSLLFNSVSDTVDVKMEKKDAVVKSTEQIAAASHLMFNFSHINYINNYKNSMYTECKRTSVETNQNRNQEISKIKKRAIFSQLKLLKLNTATTLGFVNSFCKYLFCKYLVSCFAFVKVCLKRVKTLVLHADWSICWVKA